MRKRWVISHPEYGVLVAIQDQGVGEDGRPKHLTFWSHLGCDGWGSVITFPTEHEAKEVLGVWAGYVAQQCNLVFVRCSGTRARPEELTEAGLFEAAAPLFFERAVSGPDGVTLQ